MMRYEAMVDNEGGGVNGLASYPYICIVSDDSQKWGRLVCILVGHYCLTNYPLNVIKMFQGIIIGRESLLNESFIPSLVLMHHPYPS